MRWILLVLLLLNLSLGGFLYWQHSQPEAAPQEAVSSAQFNNLVLSQAQLNRLNNAASEPVVEQPAVNEQCIRITGLTEDDSLPVIESRLKALEVISRQENNRQLIKQDFQVLLGPYASVTEARQQLDDVTARGIEGYVITSGSNANSISLGVFSNENNAQRKLDELKAVNIAAQVITKDHFADSVVLQIDRSSARLIADETLQSMLSTFKDADFLRYNCN